ncbi:MAG: patatin-like phospholipase family protein [Planctomycetota bacterium]|nr:patatin-like phospholipase family protein [Planctomycetota bacterium]
MAKNRDGRWMVGRMGAALLLAGMWVVGCGPARSLNSVPLGLMDSARIEGIPNARTWGDDVDSHFVASLSDSVRQEWAYYEANPDVTPEPTASILALSGGGENGAFGAGLLCGWSEAGTRPKFKVVSGISTGALIAPIAFLGEKYDDVLRQAYTQIGVRDVMRERGMLAIFNRDALADTEPLAGLIEKWVTDEMLQEIAAEHGRGRRLLIGTVNLEAQRPVIWDMGAIAASGHPKAGALFRKIVLASASIPGAFEPQYFDVIADGKDYQEMHVDGGTMAQVFLWGAGVRLVEIGRGAGVTKARRPIVLYIVRNGRFFPEAEQMKALFLDITGRAVASLVKTQGIGDTYRLYSLALEEDIDFNLASIPESFEPRPEKPFDNAYMNDLFDLGFRMAEGGYPWEKTPPYLQE